MEYLILRLQGPMQAWGGHTLEDYRPTELFPTRSGLIGLLGACLGIDREDVAALQTLSASFTFAARLDRREYSTSKMTDFHTVLRARNQGGRASEHAVLSFREYLCDAQFTVALEFVENAAYDLASLRAALVKPVYTPVLGRRSCPLAQPILLGTVGASDLHSALASISPHRGTVYSEVEGDSRNRLRVRDVPIAGTRQFETRNVFIHLEEPDDVSV